MLEKPWRELTFVAFDTETTGKFPIQSEVCELAAVKWRAGQVVGEFSTLIKPLRPASELSISIHGISNEVLATAPPMVDKIDEFAGFIEGSVLVGHHVPFDLGFMAAEFDRLGRPLPTTPVLCTSLLAIKMVKGTENHRLQTLLNHFGIERATAHRALDDTKACLQVLLRLLEMAGDRSLKDFSAIQGGVLEWPRFSLKDLREKASVRELLRAAELNAVVEASYGSGPKANEPRRMWPRGFVRSLEGDYVVAYCERDQREKRFYLENFRTVRVGGPSDHSQT